MPIYERGSAWLVSVGSGKDRYRKSFKSYADAVLAEKRQLLIIEGVIDAPNEVSDQTSKTVQGGSSTKTLKHAYDLTLKDVWSQRKTGNQPRLARYVMEVIGQETSERWLMSLRMRGTRGLP
jgi:hypothetical protein